MKYTDGLIEQWHSNVSNSGGRVDVILPVAYSNTNYSIIAVDERNEIKAGTSTALYVCTYTGTKTNSGFTLCQYNSSAFKASWTTKGY